METYQIRDRRGTNRYFIDNSFLRGGWGAALGPYSIAVYNAIALHADAETQQAYPSHGKIAQLIGISARQVMREIDELARYHIIDVQSRAAERKPALITLLADSEWIKPEHMTPSHKTGSHKTGSPQTYDSESHEQDSENKTQKGNGDSLTTENLLPPGIDNHQRHVDRANGGNGTDPVGEVAKHLRWLCAGPGVPLPTTKKARKPYDDAARNLLEDTDPRDWKGVCFTIDDWSEHPPGADRWRRDRATEPHFALTQIGAHYWRLRNRADDPPPAPVELEPPPELQPYEALWDQALADLRTSMARSIYDAHLARAHATGRDDGVLHLAAESERSAEWIRERLAGVVLAAVRGVDAAVEAVEVGT